jgi:hypothetical protein
VTPPEAEDEVKMSKRKKPRAKPKPRQKEIKKPEGKNAQSRALPPRLDARSLDEIFTAGSRRSVAVDEQLGADQVAQILVDCIPRSGGNGNEVGLSKDLQWYGFDDQRGIDVLNSWIIGNSDCGVPKYGFQLSGDALNFAVPSTLLSEMANAVQNKATRMASP